MSEERIHSKFSPSGWAYLAKCPSYRKEEGATNIVAELGTTAHKAVETRNLEGFDDRYKEAIRKCIALEDELALNADEVLTEVQLEMVGQKGFVDVAMRQGSSGRIIDYKFSYNAVEPAETNWQGYGYLIGLWERWPEVEAIEVIFFMPFLSITSRHTFTRKADYPRLKLLAEQLLREAEKGETQNPNDYCIYCGVRSTCVALSNKFSLVAQRYDSLTIPTELHSSKISNGEQMAEAVRLADVAIKWGESVKSHAKEFATQGHKIPGYELAQRAGAREITNVPVAWDILKGYASEAELLSTIKINYGDLEKLISDRATKGTKSKTLIALQDTLKDHDALERRASVMYLKKTKNHKLIETQIEKINV